MAEPFGKGHDMFKFSLFLVLCNRCITCIVAICFQLVRLLSTEIMNQPRAQMSESGSDAAPGERRDVGSHCPTAVLCFGRSLQCGGDYVPVRSFEARVTSSADSWKNCEDAASYGEELLTFHSTWLCLQTNHEKLKGARWFCHRFGAL